MTLAQLLGLLGSLFFLGQALTVMLVYVWSRRNPRVRVNFFGLLTFQAPFLPWALMGFSLLLGNSILVDLLGEPACASAPTPQKQAVWYLMTFGRAPRLVAVPEHSTHLEWTSHLSSHSHFLPCQLLCSSGPLNKPARYLLHIFRPDVLLMLVGVLTRVGLGKSRFQPSLLFLPCSQPIPSPSLAHFWAR